MPASTPQQQHEAERAALLAEVTAEHYGTTRTHDLAEIDVAGRLRRRAHHARCVADDHTHPREEVTD